MSLFDWSYPLLVATLVQALAASMLLILAPLAGASGDSIPWAWAINGFASVVGSVLATLLAIHLGFAAVILLAVLIYAVACVALTGFAR